MAVDRIEIDPRRGSDAGLAQQLLAEGQAVIRQMADIGIDIEGAFGRRDAGEAERGQGVEQALIASVRSTPEAIQPEINRLAARLRARWATEAALRALADELDDATGDLIAANLMLAARRRTAGVARVLESLAESVAADVRARREIEADRAKPRSTARWVTIGTVGMLIYLSFTGDFVAPYGTALGQVLLALYLSAYLGALVWMKRMARGRPLPRFIGTTVKGGAR